jgi:putative lipoprotein
MWRAAGVLLFMAMAAPGASLLGTEWGQVGTKSTLLIATDAKISGRAPCNRFFGEAQVQGTKLKMSDLGSTRMGCAEDVMRAEREYLDGLQLVEKWKVKGGELVLTGKKLKVALRFRKL